MADQSRTKTSLERAIRAMQLRPAIARACHAGSAVVDAEGLGCTYRSARHQIRMDVPSAIGAGSAPSPGEHARAALSGCIAIGIKMFACLREVPVSEVKVDLEVDADDRADFGLDDVPPGYEAFRLKISVQSPASRRLVEELIADALAASPLLDLHRRAQNVLTEIEILAPGDAAE
jgi:uncharacterized OsmC-like protein